MQPTRRYTPTQSRGRGTRFTAAIWAGPARRLLSFQNRLGIGGGLFARFGRFGLAAFFGELVQIFGQVVGVGEEWRQVRDGGPAEGCLVPPRLGLLELIGGGLLVY